MNVIIKETGEVKSLSIIDPKTKINYVSDFIGNAGGFVNGDFVFDEETGSYQSTQANFDWWNRVVSDNQALGDRIFELTSEHGGDVVADVVNSVGSIDLEDHAFQVSRALDEAFGSN